jgi:hypothetical protein
MKRVIIITALSALFLWSCSWQQYFRITNSAGNDILVEYCIRSRFNGFPIFDHSPEFFHTASNGKIDWNKPIDMVAESFSDTIIRFQLSTRSTAIIGRLSNDHYTDYKQYFINGRVFNLVYVKIINKKDTTVIVPETFDQHFGNSNGTIELIVK